MPQHFGCNARSVGDKKRASMLMAGGHGSLCRRIAPGKNSSIWGSCGK
jgi:hypothetical protein